MNKQREIAEELLEISPLVAGIIKTNVFAVPEGYFDSISDTVLACLTEASGTSTSTTERSDIPSNYFNTLSDNILAKIKQQESSNAANELKEISPLLFGIDKRNPFDVPAEYFESVSSNVALQLDMEILPANLEAAKNIQPFKVPEGYFENLPADILNTINQQQGAKVVTMGKRSSWIRYAAAAMITGALALGVIKYTNKPSGITGDVLTAQLDPIIETGKSMDDKKFDETLNNLSEEDIVKYLEKNSNDADLAALSSTVEEKDLPKQEDYLLDNTTLDNFLQELDNKNSDN